MKRAIQQVAFIALLICRCLFAAAGEQQLPDFFSQEVARLTKLANSPCPALRIEAAQGFRLLQHRSGEAPLLQLSDDTDPDVRLEVIRALGRCGGRRTAPVLVAALSGPCHHTRGLAHTALCRMTAQRFDVADIAKWDSWLKIGSWEAKQAALIAQLNSAESQVRCRALRALRYIGGADTEELLLQWLGKRQGVGREETRLAIEALERLGSPKSLPFLTAQAAHYQEAAWALGEIAGPDAEAALLAGLQRFRGRPLGYMTNLDRVRSTKCERFLPLLLGQFGLVIYRAQTDELHRPPTARQRVAANLILRTGKASQVVDLILAECEGKRRDETTPKHLRALLSGMREELRPGFVRSDGVTVAQPLAALPHITKDTAFVPRLIALLKHRAYIVRIYSATTLATLHAHEALKPIEALVREPYPFVDGVELASGKHFGRSQAVRWRGFLCMALGRLGGDQARAVLEDLATTGSNTRDIRYGAVVGLRFLASPKSLPALERVVSDDIIWMIRREAQDAVAEIELLEDAKEAAQ